MTSSARWRTAAVLIARDEAPRIARALDSVRPWVDALWVLDTGSQDATAAIAAEHGAHVGHLPWPNDFAAARNAALDAAAADWHLVIDADEWLTQGGEALAALRHTAPDHVGLVAVASAFGGQTATSHMPRLLPGAVRYAGAIHEQPVHALPVRATALVLAHDGYEAEAMARKQGRNAALLQASLARTPADAYLWYQLGKDHDAYGRWADALAAFNEARARLDRPLAWAHDMEVRTLHALKCEKRHAEALIHAEQLTAAWGHSPDLYFALGDLLLDWAADEPARAPELVPLMRAAWQHCLTLGERPDLEGAVAGRGSHLAAANLSLLENHL